MGAFIPPLSIWRALLIQSQQAKINDRGILSLAYNVKVNQGLTFGIGGSFDTQKLNEAGHKIGTSFTFEG
jgi:voltage-dependent anion channel protein 2